MKTLTAALACVALLGCTKAPEPNSPTTKEVFASSVHTPTSLIAIIADPVRFHGKTVHVTGFYRHGFEVSGIFPSRDLSFAESNGLWLDYAKDAVVKPAATDPVWDGEAQWLQVEGVVDAEATGHLGAWTGTIHASKVTAYPVGWLDDRTK